MSLAKQLEKAGDSLRVAVNAMDFAEPTHFVYNPLDYAWEPYALYLQKFAATPKRIIFMGMNPGPFGMAQVGIPFGEVAAVRDWMGIETPVGKPPEEHPKRPIEGFACKKSEVSGRRLWSLFAEHFAGPEDFFKEHFVTNYCPLVFMKETGANLTPDKLPVAESRPLFDACNEHLRQTVEILQAEWIIGIGAFAEKQAEEALAGMDIQFGRILHPSPASPAANRDWSGTALKQLKALGIWQ